MILVCIVKSFTFYIYKTIYYYQDMVLINTRYTFPYAPINHYSRGGSASEKSDQLRHWASHGGGEGKLKHQVLHEG